MPIQRQNQGWILETRRTAYAFGLNKAGLLTHRYWGARLPYPDDYPSPPNPIPWASFNNPSHLTPEEYPGYSDMKFIEPCLKVTLPDGVRNVVLRYEGEEADQNELRIVLHDDYFPLRVRVHYCLHEAYDLIERFVTLTNHGDQPFTVERVWSAQWHLPPGDQYRLNHLTGRWSDENHIRREPLVQGVKVLESRRITTSHHHSPWFAVDRGHADEDSGEVWFGLLAWSGNWKIAAEVTDFFSTRINIGLNDWDFAWRLNPGESFTTPSAYAGYTEGGFGAASRVLHDFIRENIIPHGLTPHKVLYNSWESVFFDVNEQNQIQVAELAAQMGVELFVMDDGWYHGRNMDNAGLGDWWPDEKKFPNGLNPLIQRVNDLGMDFGLWIEPEMVNPDSDLYRAHPDWVLHFPNRARTEGRNQLILNLARADVQDYLIGVLDKLLTDHNITFIKWDMNRNVSEPGWPDAPGDAREVWVRYVWGVYRVWETLRVRHPNVFWQSCSGGGGRADLGILRMADQIWPSDNTTAAGRLSIQEGFSQVFPAIIMEAQVTDMEGQTPLSFRFHVAMCGMLGVSANIAHWDESQREEAARWIALYKEIRPIIQFGDQYRLRSAQEGAFSAVQYMAKDGSEGVLFAFRTLIPYPAPLLTVRLRGLIPEARYTVEGFDEVRSGAAWMRLDIPLPLADFDSTVRRIRRVG
jgi:alpha-galactosidase